MTSVRIIDGVYVVAAKDGRPALMIYRVKGGWRRREIVGTCDDGVMYAGDDGPFKTKALAMGRDEEAD